MGYGGKGMSVIPREWLLRSINRKCFVWIIVVFCFFFRLFLSLALWWLEEQAPSCWTCIAGRVSSMYLVSSQSCGPTACGNTYSKEKVSVVTAAGDCYRMGKLVWTCTFYFPNLCSFAKTNSGKCMCLHSQITCPHLCTVYLLYLNKYVRHGCNSKGCFKSTVSAASRHAPILQLLIYVTDSVSSCVPTCLWLSVFAGPIITLESLGSGGAPSKLSKRHWLRLLKQPAVWWDKEKGSVHACANLSV